jgi:hypothetical protein
MELNCLDYQVMGGVGDSDLELWWGWRGLPDRIFRH